MCLGRDYDPTAPPMCREPAARGCLHCTPYLGCVQSGRGFGDGGKCASRITCDPTCCDCLDYVHCAANSQAEGCVHFDRIAAGAPEKCGSGLCDPSCLWRMDYVAACPGVGTCDQMPSECNECMNYIDCATNYVASTSSPKCRSVPPQCFNCMPHLGCIGGRDVTGGHGAGPIIGGVLGGLVALCLVIGLFVYISKKKGGGGGGGAPTFNSSMTTSQSPMNVPREVSLGAMASFSQPQPKFDVNTGERL